MEIVNIMDMASKLCLIPIEVNPVKQTLVALGVTGGLVYLTFAMVKKVYSTYIAGGIPTDYSVQLNY